MYFLVKKKKQKFFHFTKYFAWNSGSIEVSCQL